MYNSCVSYQMCMVNVTGLSTMHALQKAPTSKKLVTKGDQWHGTRAGSQPPISFRLVPFVRAIGPIPGKAFEYFGKTER